MKSVHDIIGTKFRQDELITLIHISNDFGVGIIYPAVRCRVYNDLWRIISPIEMKVNEFTEYKSYRLQ